MSSQGIWVRRQEHIPGRRPRNPEAVSRVAPGEVAVRTVGLTRVFGRRRAVDSVSLEIKAGEVFGFLGPNGAGKTTTINMILGLIRPTAGYVEILGQRARWAHPALRRHVGSLLDGVRFHPYLSGRDNLRFFAAALGGVPPRVYSPVCPGVPPAVSSEVSSPVPPGAISGTPSGVSAVSFDARPGDSSGVSPGVPPCASPGAHSRLSSRVPSGVQWGGVPSGVPATAGYGRIDDEIEEVLELVGLAPQAAEPVRGYSHGMRRRLGLALALVRDPAVLVLDEPANGLDPAGMREMRDIMRALAAHGKAVFLSSHLLHEVELTCDRVAILRRGTVVAQGRVDELLSAASSLEIAVDRPDEAEQVLLSEIRSDGGGRRLRGVRRDGEMLIVEYDARPCPCGVEPRQGEAVVMPSPTSRQTIGMSPEESRAAYRAVATRLSAALAAKGLTTYEIRPRQAVLEDVFFEVMAEEDEEQERDGEKGSERRE